MAPRERPVASSRRATVAPSYPWWAKTRRAPSRIRMRCASRWAWVRFGTTALYKTVQTFYFNAMLRNRSLAALLVAELVSTTGIQMTFVALPWFVLETTGSVTKMSYVLAAEILPVALFGVPSGSVVQRLGSRRTMLLADLVRAPLIALVPLLHRADALSFPLLLALVFTLGLFSAPYYAAQRTIVPELVGDDEGIVAQAAALFGGATHVTLVVGPALGGLLVGWLGAEQVLLLDAVTYLVAFVIVLALVRGGAAVSGSDGERGVLAGVRYLARDRILGPLLLTVILLDMCGSALFASLPALAFLRFDRNPHVAGLLFAAFGAGALVGSVLAVHLLQRFRPLRLAAGALLLAAAPLWLLVASLPAAGVAGVLFLCGAFVPLVNAPAMGMITCGRRSRSARRS